MLYCGTDLVTKERIYCLCDECPLDGGNALRRYNGCKKYGLDEWQPEYLGCDKVQAPFYVGGSCEDAFAYRPGSNSSPAKKQGAAERRAKSRRAINRKKAIIGRKITPYYASIGGFANAEKAYIRPKSRSVDKKFFKKQSNRRVRRTKYLADGGAYRRYEDRWWHW